MDPDAEKRPKAPPFIPGWWHLLLTLHLAIFVFIVPKFKSVYSSLNQTLPPLTSLVLSLSDLTRSWPGLILGVGILMGSFFLNSRIRRTKRSNLFFITTGIGMILALGLVVLALRLPMT